MYIPYKSGHVSHTIKNYVSGEIKRYIKYNSLKLTFLKIRMQFFSRLRNRGFKKVWLRKTFSTFQYEDRPKLMKNSHCPIPEFQMVPETEVANLIVRDSERILKESLRPRLNFNPSFTDGVIPDRRGTETLVPEVPLILGGGTTSGCRSNTIVQDNDLPKDISFISQEPRATAAATIHQAAETTHKMGQKTSLKRSAVPSDENNESRSVYLILPSYAEKHSKEIKQVIATEKLKLCSNEIFKM